MSFLRVLKTFTQAAKMSTATTPAKIEWMCIMPDKAGALEKRLAVRSQHFEGLKPLTESGFITFGGVMFDEVPKDGETPKMRGSVMTAVGATKEEVVEQLKKDIYTTSGVWDWDQAQIYPFKAAVRKALE